MSRESTLALCKELRSPVVILDILSWAKLVMHLQVRILTETVQHNKKPASYKKQASLQLMLHKLG